jgi:hypothetical protein
MEKSEQINDLATALAKAQAAIMPAAKDGTNPHFRSKYASLGAVWEACRAPLNSNGLSVVQMPADAGPERVGLTSMLIHTSGQYIACTYSTKLQQDNAQGVGSALTYLRRYGLAALIGIVADEDDDGNAASQPRQSSTPASYQQPAANGHSSAPNKITDKQRAMLFAIWKKNEFEGTLEAWIETNYKVHVSELTTKQASEAIETLQPQPA